MSAEPRSRPVRPVVQLLTALGLAVLVAACSDGEPAPFGLGQEVTITGTLTYSRVPIDTTGADPVLDYTNITEEPIRGATVEVVQDGEVYHRGGTDGSGSYSVFAPANATVTVRVVAELGGATTPVVQVTDGSAVYTAGRSDVQTGADRTTQTLDFNATTSHGGGSYTDRTGAPFAILDTIYTCMQTVAAVDGSIDFPFLEVRWSKSTAGSFFSPTGGFLQIYGIEDTDTDEYDTHVIAHEWGHYYLENFSRDDSPGGPHSIFGTALDERVAYSEGLANAIAGMLLGGLSVIADTAGTDQAGAAGFTVDLEADNQTGSFAANAAFGTLSLDGWYSELSVAEVLWDIYDGAADGESVALGFGPIHTALRSAAVKDTRYFTSIYQLLEQLKTANSGSAAAIQAIATAENIPASGDDFQDDGFAPGNRYRLVNVPGDGSGVTVTTDNGSRTLGTHDEYGTIDYGNTLNNKLFNRQMFHTNALAAGTYRVKVTGVSGGTWFINQVGTFGDLFDGGGADDLDFTISVDSAERFIFSVGNLSTEETFTVSIEALPAG